MSRLRLAAALLPAALCLAAPARAIDLGVKVEPAPSLPLGDPQGSRFGLGAEITIKGALAVTPWFHAQLTALFLGVPAVVDGEPPGLAYALGAGGRLGRGHSRGRFVFPWLDVDALYVRTGPLDRFGFAIGAGVAFPLASSRTFWLGPFVRYLQIVEPQRAGYDDTDAKVLAFGVSLEIAPPHRAAPPVAPAVTPGGAVR